MKSTFLLSRKAGTAFLIACVSVVVLLSSCIKEPKPEPVGEATIKFVNTVQGSSAQDLYVNGAKKSTVPLLYGQASSYFTITSGGNQFAFANEGTAIASGIVGINVPIGAKYNVFLMRGLSSGTTAGEVYASYLPIDSSAPATGKAKVRFLHLNSFYNKSFAIGIVGGSSLLTGLGFASSSNYFPVDAGAKLTLTAPDITTSDLDLGFVDGKIYTVWFDGSTATELNAHVIVEN